VTVQNAVNVNKTRASAGKDCNLAKLRLEIAYGSDALPPAQSGSLQAVRFPAPDCSFGNGPVRVPTS
jgi:hypothetical protein